MNILVTANHGNFLFPKDGADRRRRHLVEQLLKGNKITALESNRYVEFVGFNWQPNDLKVCLYHDYHLQGYPISVPFLDFNPNFLINMWKVLKGNSFDLIQISFPFGIFATKLLVWILKQEAAIVYDSHNVESELVKAGTGFPQPLHCMFSLYVWLIEYLATKCSTLILTISEDDRELFAQRYRVPQNKMIYVPFCAEDCQLGPLRRKTVREGLELMDDEIGVLFHGTWNYPPNQDAIRNITDFIAPRVQVRNRKVKLFIAGKGVPCQRKDNVIFLGFIDNLSDLLNAMDLAIVPDGDKRRTGVRIKLVEYLAFGLPVITTVDGARGLKLESGRHAIIVGEAGEEFVDRLVYYADNDTDRQELGIRAREFAKANLDPCAVGNRLRDSYLKILNGCKHLKVRSDGVDK